MSGFLKLNSSDLVKGLVVAILTALVAYLGDLTTILNADPMLILKIALTSGISYLVKNLITTQDGKILGVID